MVTWHPWYCERWMPVYWHFVKIYKYGEKLLRKWAKWRWLSSTVCLTVTTLRFFYKHAVYKHVRLKLAKKLSTLLSTAQAEILGKEMLFYHFSVLLLSRCCKSSLKSIFSFLKKIYVNFLTNWKNTFKNTTLKRQKYK